MITAVFMVLANFVIVKETVSFYDVNSDALIDSDKFLKVVRDYCNRYDIVFSNKTSYCFSIRL